MCQSMTADNNYHIFDGVVKSIFIFFEECGATVLEFLVIEVESEAGGGCISVPFEIWTFLSTNWMAFLVTCYSGRYWREWGSQSCCLKGIERRNRSQLGGSSCRGLAFYLL